MPGHGLAFDGPVEARPAAAGLVFRIGGEQRLAAAHAGENPLALFIVERARASALGAVLARDAYIARGSTARATPHRFCECALS